MHKDFDFSLVPEVIYDRKPALTALYRRAWELASDHVLVTPGLPVERHMDEGFAPNRNWIWDTCFMVHYCKYSPKFFPGVESLDNFYRPLYDGEPSSCLIQHPDNPPLFAWVEYEYAKFTGDLGRIHRILVEKRYLQRHYDWFETAKTGERYTAAFLLNTIQKNECGYLWSGISSGMDNTPRGRDVYTNLYWLDALAQQALSALYIARLAEMIGEGGIKTEFLTRYEEKKALLNQYYFDETDGSYYDIYAATHDVCRVLTPASFWALLAEAASPEQAARQVETLLDPEKLGGEVPCPSVARNSPEYRPDGRYWRGGVWLPTSYMTMKAIGKYGRYDLAAELSERLVDRMAEVYETFTPHTIWEAYAPGTEALPAATRTPEKLCRPDFCGWSALGPISLLIENVLGFHEADAGSRLLRYRHRPEIGRHGIRRLRFGDIVCDLLADNGKITVEANRPFTLEINGTGFPCSEGNTLITIS